MAHQTQVSVAFTPALFAPGLMVSGECVVVIDTLRASTTIIAALLAGAREVIPVEDVEQAVAAAGELGTDRTLLGGERRGLKIDGFDLGNSPLEYTAEVVEGKTILLTTTNGTRALRAASAAHTVLCGTLLNADSVARFCSELDQNVTLLCAGTNGGFSMDDAIAAGGIIDAMRARGMSLQLDDASVAAYELFDLNRTDLRAALEATGHGKRLMELGFGDDIVYCAQLSLQNAPVPRMIGSSLRAS